MEANLESYVIFGTEKIRGLVSRSQLFSLSFTKTKIFCVENHERNGNAAQECSAMCHAKGGLAHNFYFLFFVLLKKATDQIYLDIIISITVFVLL